MFNESIILQVLAEQKEEVENYNFSQWTPRREEALFEFDSSLAQIVIGVRRSGKSTLCHKVLLSHHIPYGYVNLDDDRLANLQVEDLNTLLSCIYQLYGTHIRYLFLDEIQNVDGWHLFVNRLLRSGMHVFVTGSNAKLLSSELATHLTGRYNEIRLFPFSYWEYCTFMKVDVASVTTKAEAERKRAFMDYIHQGGFPEMQQLRNKRGYVQSLIEAILRKDIQQRYHVRYVEALENTANHLINNACQEVKYDDLSQLLGLSDKTLKNYVDYLRQAYLIQLLPKYSPKSKERIRNSKAYIVDPSLQNYRENALAADNLGWRLENIVYIELLRRCAREYLDIFFYKPSARQKEVDFVICNQNQVQELIQVAYEIDSEKTFKRETSALLQAAAALHCHRLTLITFSPTRQLQMEGEEISVHSVIEWLLKVPAME
jgi:predicted AAA+ superfamily ATPase